MFQSKRLQLLVCSLFLTACGGSGGSAKTPTDSGGGENNNGGSSGQTSDWKMVSVETPLGQVSGFETAKRVDNLFYFANTFLTDNKGFHLFKSSDLKTSRTYSFPENPGHLDFVDDEGSVLFDKYFMQDGENFTKYDKSGWVIGNKDVYLKIRTSNKISFDKGSTYLGTEYLGDFMEDLIVKSPKSAAFNGVQHFFFIQEKGVVIYDYLAKRHKTILKDITDIEVIATNKYHSDSVYVAKHGVLYRSLDSGENWTKVNEPTYKGSKVIGWGDLELLDDGTLIALVSTNNPGAKKGLFFESKDLGMSWKMVGKPIDFYRSISDGRLDINGSNKYYILNSGSFAYYYRER